MKTSSCEKLLGTNFEYTLKFKNIQKTFVKGIKKIKWTRKIYHM